MSMDPQTAWSALLHAWGVGDWEQVEDLAEALLTWLDRNGYPPKLSRQINLGGELNSVIVKSAAEFMLRRAREVLSSLERIPDSVTFVLSCISCDAESPKSFAQASALGWRRIEYVPSAISANFIGVCPNCQASDG